MTETPAWLAGSGLDTDMSGDERLRGSSNSPRLWMPKSTEKKVIFLTEGNAAPVLWEHQVKIRDDWRNWFTCLQPLGKKCPLCQFADISGNFGRYKAAFFTVIDTTEFVDSKGKKRVNEKRLICAKKDTAEKIKRKYIARIEEKQGLRGALFKIYRGSGDKAASVGDDFDFIKMVDLAMVPDSAEFDYNEILKPSEEKMSRLMDYLSTAKPIVEEVRKVLTEGPGAETIKY